jgi:hypothetical protein
MTRPHSLNEIQYRFVGLPPDSGGIVHRVDGWITRDPDYPDRCIPTAVATLIAEAMPLTDFEIRSADVAAQVRSVGGDSVRDIKQRMQSRQNMHERMQRHGRA